MGTISGSTANVAIGNGVMASATNSTNNVAIGDLALENS